jgi:mono/diheme cytochrome c family protein
VTGVVVGLVVIGLLFVAFAVGYNLGETRAEEDAAEQAPAAETGAAETGASEPAGDAEAAALFQESCGSCHALAAAGTSGAIGPDLDALSPSREQVLAAIANGGTGTGAMPANLVTGPDAEALADYVASVAGAPR